MHVDLVASWLHREPMQRQAFKQLPMFRHVAAEDLPIDVPSIVEDPDPNAWFIRGGADGRVGGRSKERAIPDRNRGARDERGVHDTSDRIPGGWQGRTPRVTRPFVPPPNARG